MIEKPLSNKEIEQQVLGTALVSNRAADRIIQRCDNEDFYCEAHQKILTAICEIRQRNMSIDLTTLLNYVENHFMIEAAALGNHGLTDDYLEQYLLQLKELSVKRKIQHLPDPSDLSSLKSILDDYQNEQNSLNNSTITAEEIIDSILKYYESGDDSGVSTGWSSLDEYFTICRGQLTVVTGTPGSGKSEWLDAVCINLAKKFDFKTMYFSPENLPIRRHVRKLLEKYSGNPFFSDYLDRIAKNDLEKLLHWIDQHFYFINPDTDSRSVDYLLSQIRDVDMFVLDPWNELEHKRPQNITETEYISQSLMKVKSFAVENNIHFWIVAHPTKLQKNKKGEYPIPKPYDISGSANWRNKADNCISIHRCGLKHKIQVHVQKVRFKDNGKIGMVDLDYYPVTGIFSYAK